jgi:hypothetical protein
MAGRPERMCGAVERRRTRCRCQRRIVAGVTSSPRRRGAGSSRARAAITARSVQLIRGRGRRRCSTASWWRRTRISISLATSERDATGRSCRRIPDQYRQVRRLCSVSGTHTFGRSCPLAADDELIAPGTRSSNFHRFASATIAMSRPKNAERTRGARRACVGRTPWSDRTRDQATMSVSAAIRKPMFPALLSGEFALRAAQR